MMKRIISIALLAAMLGTNVYAYSGAASWAESTLEKAANASIVPDGILDANVSSMIKKGECASLCVKFCERMSGKSAETAQNPFSDNVSEDVLKAVSLGIVGTYGGAGFNENSFASREEIADMLAKTYAYVSEEKAQISDKLLFADDANICSEQEYNPHRRQQQVCSKEFNRRSDESKLCKYVGAECADIVGEDVRYARRN